MVSDDCNSDTDGYNHRDEEEEEPLEDDDYNCDSDGYYHGDEEDEEPMNEETLDEEEPQKMKTKSYTVMAEADLRQHQEEAIAEVCAVLSVPRVAAVILLLHHQWSVSKLNEAWFADEDAVRKAVGLLDPPPAGSPKNKGVVDCGICFERFSLSRASSAACKHYYCKDCWRSYIGVAVEDGPGCLTLRCPEPSCRAAVGQDMIDSLAAAEDSRRYGYYLARSFVEMNRNTKWCPAAGCEKAVKFDADGDGDYDVYCDCTNGFCWKCDEEAHSPMDCETVNKWITKNTSESENTNWIIANSKPCPSCKKPIEKNLGCMHMTCRCGHQFCWICLRDWLKHNDKTGGYYACNGYRAGREDAPVSEDERRRILAKKAIQRYTHYYERWAANHKSWQQSLAELRRVQTEGLDELSVIKKEPVTKMEFVADAWKQIVECRRVLKWTYAYGYYLPEKEKNKKEFFEFLQGDAESHLERLHGFTETRLKHQLNCEVSHDEMGNEMVWDEKECRLVKRDKFEDFRKKLVGLTSVTKSYFEKLVKALENGLPDVASGSSSGYVEHIRSRPWWAVDLEDQPNGWACDRCTYMNEMDATYCVVCYGGDDYSDDE